MPGLINAAPQQQSQQPAQQPPQQTSPQQPAQPSPEQIKQKTFQIQKIALAAQKVMYGEKTGKEFLKTLQGDDVVQMASKAAANVMMILIAESNLRINPELVIPAGVIVVGDILDFIEKAKGITHTEAQVEDSIEAFINQMMTAVGKSPQQAQQPQQPVQSAGVMQ